MNFHILLILATLSCGLCAHLDQDWWRHGEIYDIYTWAFRDSDGDGFGDLAGLTSKLNYIKDLGVTAIKISSVSSSVQDINPNYAIDDFRKIHLTLGKMEDFDNLMKEAKSKGIKVILDFVINHCSTSHEWFKKSQRKIDPYTDYFIWKNKTDYYRKGMNWEWDRKREQLYYHKYELPSADLNLRNEAVKEEVKKLIKFWFDKGISGLNLISAYTYLEYFPSEDNGGTESRITENHFDSYEFVHELRDFVDSYNKAHGGSERILIVEKRPYAPIANLHGNSTFPIAHIVTENLIEQLYSYTDIQFLESEFFHNVITTSKEEKENGPVLLVSEDETTFRLPNRFSNKQLIDIWLTTAYMLPNVLHIYYGQEIGLSECWSSNWNLAYERPLTSAMQWDDSLLAGFTDSEFTLLPPNIDYWENNVENLKNAKFSKLGLVKDLLQLRKSETVKNGDVKSYIISKWIYAFSRSYEGKETYIVIINLENIGNGVTLFEVFKQMPKKVKVVASSTNSIHRKGDVIETQSSTWMRPCSCMVVMVQ